MNTLGKKKYSKESWKTQAEMDRYLKTYGIMELVSYS
jgi:hypothetical protein